MPYAGEAAAHTETAAQSTPYTGCSVGDGAECVGHWGDAGSGTLLD